jgi:hypothetical protein
MLLLLKEEILMLKCSTSILLAMSIVGCGILKKKSSDDQPSANAPAPNPESQGPDAGDDQKKPEGTGTPAPQVKISAADQFKANIQGQWKTSCASSSDRSSKITNFLIEGSSMSVTSGIYTDGSCRNAKFALRYNGPYSVTAPATTKTGGYNMSYQFNSFYMTLYSADTVLSFNLLGLCGMSDWTLGVEKKLSSSMPDCSLAKDAEDGVLASPFNTVMVQSNSALSEYDTDASSAATYVMQKQ